jgi:hypothetical protein
MKKVFLVISMLVIATLACSLTVTAPTATEVPVTTTPEIFIARTQAIPAQVQLNGITLAVQEAQLDVCDLPDCPPALAGTRYLRVTLQALNLPSDQFLDYKNLPEGIAIHDNTGANTPFKRLVAYSPAAQQLTLYFAVPENANVFGLQWPGVAEIPLTVTANVVPTALPHVEGVEVSVGPLSVTVPSIIASGARGSQLPRADGQDLPYFEKTPGHTILKLEGYVLQDKFHHPQIYVYPASAYAQMVPAAFESIHRLDNLIYSPATPVTISKDQLPNVPFFNAAQVFASNIQMISFQNGGGVRFLTEYAQYAAPVNNHELIYHFEGVSRDGAYYIVAILPITAPGLAETSEVGAVIPVGGFAYPDINDPNANWPGYYSDVTHLLNNTATDAFTPTLSQLDALIQSIKITP